MGFMRRLCTSLLVALGLFSLPMVVYGVNESEPNDSPETANVLELGDIAYGTGGVMWEPDWWKVTLTEDGDLTVVASGIGSDIHLALYDENGVDYFMWQWGITDVTVYHHTLGAGTYYIRIWSYYSWSADYEMTATLDAQETLNDAEPNDDILTALPLDENGTAYGHINYYYEGVTDIFDFYQVELTGDGLLELALSSENNVVLWMYLYDSDGLTLLKQGNSDATFVVDRADLAAGTYYVIIGTYYTFDASGYTLESEFSPVEQANDPEPNNSLAESTIMDINSSMDGHCNYYNNGERDSFDIYKIILPYEGDLGVHLSPGTPMEMFCGLYASDGITLINSVVGHEEMGIYNAGLPAGIYYVFINMYYSSDFTGYVLGNEYETDIVTVDELDTGFKLFPNPASSYLSIVYQGTALSNASFELFNVEGQLLTSYPMGALVAGNQSQIDISPLSDGVYLLLLRQNGQTISATKFVCQH
jgi:hypothetical protein